MHLSEREQLTVNRIITDITNETEQNLDKHSTQILVSSLDLLLKYTDRFFNRQFLTRDLLQSETTEKFNAALEHYYNNASISGLPTVKSLASQLNMSPGYMSDTLKHDCGKSAQELIHLYLIEKAKYQLLNSEDSISTIAYNLGFEYPQYFSRLFKQKAKVSPQEFRALH